MQYYKMCVVSCLRQLHNNEYMMMMMMMMMMTISRHDKSGGSK